jgi:hypothetical protein
VIATIPYTKNPDECIEHLKKYGHDLILIPKTPIYTFKFMYFKCSICKSGIRLQPNQFGLITDCLHWKVIVDDSRIENAGFYCEKFRALY